jgi:hypothetical protein
MLRVWPAEVFEALSAPDKGHSRYGFVDFGAGYDNFLPCIQAWANFSNSKNMGKKNGVTTPPT